MLLMHLMEVMLPNCFELTLVAIRIWLNYLQVVVYSKVFFGGLGEIRTLDQRINEVVALQKPI